MIAFACIATAVNINLKKCILTKLVYFLFIDCDVENGRKTTFWYINFFFKFKKDFNITGIQKNRKKKILAVYGEGSVNN